MGFLGVIALHRLKQQGDRGIWGNREGVGSPGLPQTIQGFKDLDIFDFSFIKPQLVNQFGLT
jgi:hypothetical protein